MVRWLNDSEESEVVDDDLPWYRNYYQDASNRGRTFHVIECYASPKGLLLLTSEFKTFVFKREKWATFIQAALTEWINDSLLPNCLVIGYGKAGKPLFGIDEDIRNTYWVLEDNHYIRKYNTGGSEPSTPSYNPLLPPPLEYGGSVPATTSTTGRRNKRSISDP